MIIQPRLGDNMGQLVDPNQASMIKGAAGSGQPPGYSSIKIHINIYFHMLFLLNSS